MGFVLLSVICSVLVSVLLKLARRYAVDVGQAIAWNYVVASALTLWLLPAPLTELRAPGTAWLALIGLGVLLPTIFLALAASVRHAGIVRSDAAQRLSLLLSLLAAFVWFGEQLDVLKAVGIALGLLALLGMVWKQQVPEAAGGVARRHADGDEASASVARWLYPLLVFVGFAVIDILLKQVALAGIPLGASLQVMFALALVVACALQLWRRARRETRFTLRSALGGVILGLFNFGNILFYLRAHRALPQHPALVFTSMNIGVVALGAMVGLLVFREQLSKINVIGVALAIVAIGLVARP